MIKRSRFPPAPEDVQLVYGDEDPIPVDCTYAGWDRDVGCHVWVVVNSRPAQWPTKVLIAKLPPKTSVQIRKDPV